MSGLSSQQYETLANRVRAILRNPASPDEARPGNEMKGPATNIGDDLEKSSNLTDQQWGAALKRLSEDNAPIMPLDTQLPRVIVYLDRRARETATSGGRRRRTRGRKMQGKTRRLRRGKNGRRNT